MAGMMGEGDAPRRARVLVVDDERPMRRLLHVVLEGEGYEVFEAEGVRSAIHAAAALRPDLILLDLGLPDGDGIEVIQRVREWSAVPILRRRGRHLECVRRRLGCRRRRTRNHSSSLIKVFSWAFGGRVWR